MHRVLIKLRNQGERGFVGGYKSDQHGKVYPTYRNTLYVREWGEMEFEWGTLRYPTSSFGNTDAPLDVFEYVRTHERLPEDITFIDGAHGIDPYTFLDLQ